MSVNHCLPVPVFYFWRKQLTLHRGLSGILFLFAMLYGLLWNK